jgi:hypothetical protein
MNDNKRLLFLLNSFRQDHSLLQELYEEIYRSSFFMIIAVSSTKEEIFPAMYEIDNNRKAIGLYTSKDIPVLKRFYEQEKDNGGTLVSMEGPKLWPLIKDFFSIEDPINVIQIDPETEYGITLQPHMFVRMCNHCKELKES